MLKPGLQMEKFVPHTLKPIITMTTNDKDKLAYLKDEMASCDCPECSGISSDIGANAGVTDAQYWQAAGEYFGYPQCCIDEFIVSASKRLGPSGDRGLATDYGFVPCEKHSRELLSGMVTYDELINDRLAPLPFKSPRWTEPYNNLLLKTTVFALFAKMPKHHIKLAITTAHEAIGERALLNCKEKWDEYERLKAEQEDEREHPPE